MAESKGEPGIKVLETARNVIRIEAEEVARLEERVGEQFLEAVNLVASCIQRGGKVIVTGVGKSGLIATKVAATMNSTGTTAFFMHPVEAAHGDLGMVSTRDVVIAISKSGRTEELAVLLPTFKRLGTKIIAITGDLTSDLARESDLVLDAGVRQEACPYGLAPTASSSCALAMGDALAIAVFVARGLRPEDFAFHHPGGTLGKRLLLKVEDIMHTGASLPLVGEDATMRDALVEIIDKKLGVTGVVASDGRLTGIITDGDIKRILIRNPDVKDIREVKVGNVMTRQPRTIEKQALVTRAIQRMEEDPRRLITCLMVVDPDRHPIGLVHMHDCLRAGIA
ncbi:MAG TPA: KpsF/GutQ family sugar-phosphate isomerase [bacterium]|nr:KpsF/GutQ family sugar-phosphate isomerase [bacterium]